MRKKGKEVLRVAPPRSKLKLVGCQTPVTMEVVVACSSSHRLGGAKAKSDPARVHSIWLKGED